MNRRGLRSICWCCVDAPRVALVSQGADWSVCARSSVSRTPALAGRIDRLDDGRGASFLVLGLAAVFVGLRRRRPGK